MLDEYKDIQILDELERIKEEEEKKEEESSRYYTNGFNSFDYVMRETEDSLKIGPSVDALVFFWIPLGIIILAAMFLGGGA